MVKLLIRTVPGAVVYSLSVCTLSGDGEGMLYLHVSPLRVQTLDAGENLLLVTD